VSRLARLGPLLPVLAAALAMAAWSWGTGLHPFIDFGRELYAPWRLSLGDVLYRDVAWFNGPLSAYLHALLFRALGPGLDVLMGLNLLVSLAILALLYHLLAGIASRWAAAVATGFVAVTVAFTQMEPVGNDGWLAPYSHEITHGLLLALAALALADGEGRRRVGLAGVVLGAVALTKVELGMAAAAGVVALRAGRAGALGGEGRLELPALAVGAAVAPALAFALLATALPAGEALRGVAGSWWGSLDPELVGHPFYRWTRGTLEPGTNLRLLAAWGTGGLLAVGAGALAGRRWPGTPRGSEAIAAGLVALPLALVPLDWTDAPRPLPLVLLGWLVLELRRPAAERDGLRIGLLVFALALLAKVILKVRLIQYGFVLAVPGLALVTVAGLDLLPAWLRARAASGRFVRGAVLGVLGIATASLLQVASFYVELRHHPVGEGRDAFRSDGRARLLNAAVRDLDARMAPGDTLLVLPEGVMLNYLLRHPTPTRHLNYMPPELILFGEEQILAELRARPPDWVAIVHKDTSVYGVPLFGRDYGEAIDAWVRSAYRRVARYGEPPLRPGTFFGVDVLAPRPAPGGS